jgi:hypothetical protein
MRIDIDSLTEAELVDLNNRIVERLRFLHQARSHRRMLDFKIGDRVSFQPEGRYGGWHAHPLQQKVGYRHHGGRRALECRSALVAPDRRIQHRSGSQSEYRAHSQEMSA